MADRFIPVVDTRENDEGGSDCTEDTVPNCYTPTSESLDNPGLDPATTPMPPQTTDEPKGSKKASAAKPGPGFIEMRMTPAEWTDKPWVAFLVIGCEDVPRLMREGFFWSTENVVPEEGYISDNIRKECEGLGCRHKRTWIIADKANDKAPQWKGRLEVTSPLLATLAAFRVKDLSRKNVYASYAWNWAGKLIYNYDYRYPKHNFNCIYDDEPLKVARRKTNAE
ncbi:uncharacterized protein B0H64DRAFT_428690 [Chaetomium fimeti]|uniref:Uncharacterized protein n=1 Tax=Chaetomium fimeti TaxID=1854472 RepID=A0AAE0LX04_9PEZI|nr:hypothetical protein B0H64DRAFT_428690 [Chaetomium fimeti]